MPEFIARLRSLWRGTLRTRQVDAELQEEFRHHIELRTADLVALGMSPDEAARSARAEFGGVEDHVEKARTARGLRWFDEMRFSWLDLKLGGRMLVKYPVLTIVGGISIAFAIWVGAATFEGIRQLVFPAIPLPDSDRIVVLQNYDAAESEPELRSTHDFVRWREALRSVDDLAAYRTVTRNMMITPGVADPVFTAEVTASAFRVLRVPPLLGRTLIEADEQAGAPLAVVLGHDLWQLRFQGDSGVIGRTVRITGVPATVVGVMPDGFAFPRTQELWAPLRIDVSRTEPRAGMAIRIVGRLAPGATMEQANNELETLGRIAAREYPRTHQALRPQLFTFAQSVRALGGSAGEQAALLSGNLFVMMLLVLVCANVGLLMFARAATREAEIVVRSALGASRRRIVMQLFAEALVLGGVAAAIGLAAAGWGMRWALNLMRGELTDNSGNFAFWVDGRLSPMTFVYTVVLTLLAATIAGVLPGLKITRDIGVQLKRAAGASRARFGGIWTAIIVTQLAVTMGFPVVTFFVRKDAVRIETQPLPFPVEQFLSVRLEMERYSPDIGADTSVAAFYARYLLAAQKLEARLMEDPAVLGVTFAELLPRQYHPNNQVEVEEGAVPPLDERGHRVAWAAVDPKYLDTFGVSMLSGRWFYSSEATPESRVVVVNQAFVDRVMGGMNPIGRRLRHDNPDAAEPEPWFEIVGVAPDMGTNSGWGPAGIYQPLVRQSMYPMNVAIHVRGEPQEFASRLRAIATDVDVTLRLAELMPLKDVVNAEVAFHTFWVRMTTIFSAIVLVLSLVAIYAVTSFAVSRRTREIGVRVALGGSRRRILASVFAHPLRQLGMGLLAGVLLVAFLFSSGDRLPSARELLTLGAYTVLMAVVCLIAVVVPARRAMAVQPTEALRDS